MFGNLEEKIERSYLKKQTCSKETIDSAKRVIEEYETTYSTIKSDNELARKYAIVDINNQNAIEEISMLVMSACSRARGRKWMIPGKEIIWDIIPRFTQVAGGIELCKVDRRNVFGRQRTGEGKTVTLLFVIAFLAKKGSVHVLTANDYLAKRDKMWVGPILDILGITNSWLSDDEGLKRDAYKTQVLYGSDKEFTFDYLRDTIRKPSQSLICPKRDYAIIDEADHILIDELSTPIVLSQPTGGINKDMEMAKEVVSGLVKKQQTLISNLLKEINTTIDSKCVNDDVLRKITTLRYCGVFYEDVKKFLSVNYKEVEKSEKHEILLTQTYLLEEICSDLFFIVDRQSDVCYFTEKGLKTIETDYLGKNLFTIPDYKEINSRINKTRLEDLYKNQLQEKLSFKQIRQNSIIKSLLVTLQAHVLLFKDRDYIIKDNSIELITKSIGRSDSLKRFNDDLSLAVEFKENVKVKNKTTVVASTLLPNFISLYKRFSSLSGTIFPDQKEFAQTYNSRIVNVPSFKKLIAFHEMGIIYETKHKKHKAILKKIRSLYKFKNPILIGTNSVEYSEELSEILAEDEIPHHVLNARNESEEAKIVAAAGELGSIIIATNIAGRGTDIKVEDRVNNEIVENFLILLKEKLSKERSIRISCYSFKEKDLLISKLKSMEDNSFELVEIRKGSKAIIELRCNSQKRFWNVDFNLGLHVIVAETFVSRRIENQLRGRTGRQGAPGSSSLFISLEDDNLNHITSLTSLIRKVLFGKAKFLNHSQKVHNYLISMIYRFNEGNEYENRKERLFYDRITEEHRKEIGVYRKYLINNKIKEFMKLVIDGVIDDLFSNNKNGDDSEKIKEISCELFEYLNVIPSFLKGEDVIDSSIINQIKEFIWDHYLKLAKSQEDEMSNIIESSCDIIDRFWGQYLDQQDVVRVQAGRSMYLGKEYKVYYLNLITEYYQSILFELRKALALNFFQKELSNEKKSSSIIRKASLEDEISELIL